MDKNKSIDGLVTRSKKAAHSSKRTSKATGTSPKPKSPKTTKPKTTKAKSVKTTKPSKTVKAKAPKTKVTHSQSPAQPISDIKPIKTNSKPLTPSEPLHLSSADLESDPNLAPLSPEDALMDDNLPEEPLPDELPPEADPLTEEPVENPVEDFLQPVQSFDFDEQSGELTASKTPQNETPAKKPKKKLPRKKLIKRIVIGVIIFLVIAAIIAVLIINSILAKITNNQGNLFDLFTETYAPLKTDKNGRTNILAFGTSGYNMEGDEGNGVHDGAQLTDSIMVISLNQDTGDVAMLSLPRDLKVSSTCTGTGKINEIYWCNNQDGNNEQAGAEALMEEVSDILNVDFQYYAHLNWGSLIQIVDTLGGINVTLDEDIEDYYYTGAVFNAGETYTIDGAQALGLARARHGTASGDFSRGASQQKILIGIKDRIFEKSLNLGEILGLANTLGDNLRTNFSVDEMKTLAHLSSSFDFNAIRQVSLLEPEPLVTNSSIGGISYVIPSAGVNQYRPIQAYVAKMFSNDPKDYENPTILVLNGTETPGLASKEQTALKSDNYTNVDISDAPAGTYDTAYTLYVINDQKPGTKKALEEKYHVSAQPASALPAGIPTTYDFVIILGNAPAETSETTGTSE